MILNSDKLIRKIFKNAIFLKIKTSFIKINSLILNNEKITILIILAFIESFVKINN